MLKGLKDGLFFIKSKINIFKFQIHFKFRSQKLKDVCDEINNNYWNKARLHY